MKEKIEALITEYIAADEAYDDNAQIAVNVVTGEVQLLDGEEAEELSDDYTLCAAMDLVEMNLDGTWRPDVEAISEFADSLNSH
jgi:hypothetical protein